MTTAAPIVVVGGGISGLAAAFELSRRTKERIALYEASDRLGGKIRTEEMEGVTIDLGPDAFLAREPWAVELCEQLGLGERLISPAVFGAYVWIRGRLKRLPEGFVFGMPASPWAAARSGILSPFGAARAAADLFLSGPLTGPDVSIGAFVRRRFGDQVLERLVDPLLAGTRAGHADRISLAAGAPQIDALARRRRSLIAGLRGERRSGRLEDGPPPFLSVEGGLGTLVDALTSELRGRVELHLHAPVEALHRTRAGMMIRIPGGERATERVVLTTPPFVSARILSRVATEAARALATIPYASVATGVFVFPPGSFRVPPRGSGFLVPSSERRTIAAATWYSTKWPHAAPADGRLVVKCIAGRSAEDDAFDRPDDELLAELEQDFRAAMGFDAAPLDARLVRWPRALPQYEVGHAELIRDVDAALAKVPQVVLAGSGYGGTGIPDSIRRARHAAATILGQPGR